MPLVVPNTKEEKNRTSTFAVPEDNVSSILTIPGNPINKTNIEEASALNPQTFSRNRELSNILGVPSEVYDTDNTYAEQEWTSLNDEANKQIAPYTYDWMNQNPQNYSAIKDDSDDLSVAEHLLRAGSSLIGGSVTSLGMIPSGLSRLFSIAHDKTLNAFLSPFEAINPELANEIRQAVTSPIPYTPWWTNPEIGLEELGGAIRGEGEELSPEDPNFLEEVIGGVGQMGTQMAVMLATGGLGGGVALFAQGADITGEKLESTRKEGKEEEAWEGFAIVLGAGVTAVSEKYGLDILMRRIPANVRGRFTRILAGAGSEATQEVLEEVGQNLVIMGFDKNRVPESDLFHQAAVAGSVGGIVSALIPGRKRTAQNKIIIDKANELAANAKINETDPQTAAALRVEAVKGAGITGASIHIKDFVEYVKTKPDKAGDLLTQLKDKISDAYKRDSKQINLNAQEFATYIFGTPHHEAIGDHMHYYVSAGHNRTGLTPAEAINEIVVNAEAISKKAEKIENPTLRQRTLKFIKNFIEGKDIDLNEVLAKAPPSVVTHVDQIIADIRTETLTTEKQIRTARVAEIGDTLSSIERESDLLENNILAAKDAGKATKRMENRLNKLESQERALRAEESLINRVLPVQEKAIPKVKDAKPVKTKAERLRGLNVKSTNETHREARKAFRTARAGAKQDIKSAQTVVLNFIRSSGLSSKKKGEYLATITNMDSLDKLEQELPNLQQRVLKDIDRQRKAQVKGAIKKIVKKGVSANTSPAVNDLLKQAKAALKMTVGEAKAALDQEGITRNPLINTLLGLKAGNEGVSAKDAEQILLDLDQVIEGGRAIGVANVLYREAQREELRNKVKEAIGSIPKEDQSKLSEFGQKAVAYTFLGPSGSWRNKLQHIFSSKNAEKVNQLLKDLSLFSESRVYDVNVRTTANRIKELVQSRTKLTERQIVKQWNKDNSERIFTGTYTMADGTQHKFNRTKAEMRMLWMQAQNPDIRESLKDPANDGGMTEAVFEGIESQFTEFDRAMIESQLEFYGEYYSRINEAYRKNYGLNLPQVENYIPVRRDFGDPNASEEFLRSILYRGGPKPASLSSRKAGARQRIKRASDITSLQSHMAEMEYFIAFAEKVNTLNAVFSGNNNEIMNLISDSYGRKIASIIHEDLRWFSDKGAMQATAIEDVLVQLMRNFSFAQLGAKPQIGFKQLVSFSALAQDVNSVDFAKSILRLATPQGWREAKTLMSKSSFFRERGMNLDNDFKDLARDTNNNKLFNFMGTHPKFTRIMMLPIRYGDKGAILIGGYAHIKAKMKEGLSEAEALDSFARLANATQQSSDPDQLSSLQRTSAFGRVFAQFMSSANAIARAEYEAISEFSKGRISEGEFAKRILIYHFVIPNVMMFVANGMDWETEDQIQASILGAFTGVLFFGDILEFTARLALGSDRPHDIQGPHPLRFMASLIDAATGDWDIGWDDFLEGTQAIDRLLEGAGALSGIPLEALYNISRGLAQTAEGVVKGRSKTAEEGAKLALGYSPYTVEKAK